MKIVDDRYKYEAVTEQFGFYVSLTFKLYDEDRGVVFENKYSKLYRPRQAENASKSLAKFRETSERDFLKKVRKIKSFDKSVAECL